MADARTYNASFSRAEGFRDGLRPADPSAPSSGAGIDPASEAFVAWARSFQKAAKLNDDGYFGRQSLAAWRERFGAPGPGQGALVVAGRPIEVPFAASNYLDPSQPRFRSRPRWDAPPTAIVVHESVTRSRDDVMKVLVQRGLGVHLVVDADGTVTQHADLADDIVIHGGNYNRSSIGIEIINPYYADLLKPNLPWTQTIAAAWAHKGRYVLPTEAQAETLARLVDWITSPGGGNLTGIPRRWMGLSAQGLRMGPMASAARPTPGIFAHHYFAHADGAWLLLYCCLRLTGQCSAADAYAHAVALASGNRTWADLKGHVALGALGPVHFSDEPEVPGPFEIEGVGGPPVDCWAGEEGLPNEPDPFAREVQISTAT